MKTVNVRLSGPENDQEPLRFDDFIKQLDYIRQALKTTDLVVTQRTTPSVDFRVVGLSRSSPAEVRLEAHNCSEGLDRTDEVVTRFFDALDSVQHRREAPLGFDGPALRHFQAMTKLLGKQVSAVVLSANGDSIALAETFSENIELIMGRTEFSMGTVSGWLDKINVHRGQNVSELFPITGPSVTCRFSQTLRDAALVGVGKFVDISGILAYNAVDKHPHEVRAQKIEIRPDQDKRPLLSDLRGIEPNDTQGKLSEEIIGEIRNAWE